MAFAFNGDRHKKQDQLTKTRSPTNFPVSMTNCLLWRHQAANGNRSTEGKNGNNLTNKHCN